MEIHVWAYNKAPKDSIKLVNPFKKPVLRNEFLKTFVLWMNEHDARLKAISHFDLIPLQPTVERSIFWEILFSQDIFFLMMLFKNTSKANKKINIAMVTDEEVMKLLELNMLRFNIKVMKGQKV